MQNLFSISNHSKKPLSYRMRPSKLEEFVGQNEIMGEKSILRRLITKRNMVNLIFFGPPGTGKTSLAKLISSDLNYYYNELNATTATVKDIKKIVEESENKLNITGKQTILFLDEIHRFNKLQQDSLLPATEQGILILIGATTQNPYYSLNNSLLSRCLVFKFEKLTDKEIFQILKNAVTFLELKIDDNIIVYLSEISNGDSRRALNYLELIYNLEVEMTLEEVKSIIYSKNHSFDKSEDKYNTISALIKSIRGSDPNSAIYWLARLVEGGEDPEYISRRLVILASEDVGLANPDAITMASSCLAAVSKIGMPESRIILSELVIYLAISSKSNSSYLAINSAIQDIRDGVVQEVPSHLKNDNNAQYKYPHNYSGNFIYQNYMADFKKYYYPGENRNESLILEKMKKMWGEKYG